MSTAYYINTVAGKRGPFTLEQIKSAVEKGKLRETSAIAVGETEQWVEARTIPGLFPEPPADDIDDLPQAVSLEGGSGVVFEKGTPTRVPVAPVRSVEEEVEATYQRLKADEEAQKHKAEVERLARERIERERQAVTSPAAPPKSDTDIWGWLELQRKIKAEPNPEMKRKMLQTYESKYGQTDSSDQRFMGVRKRPVRGAWRGTPAPAEAARKAEEEQRRQEELFRKAELELPAELVRKAELERERAGKRKVLAISGVEYAFRFCPTGVFVMGSLKSDDEIQHCVTLTKGFLMLETQVTQEMWESVMGSNPSHFKGEKLPVESVSWDDCQVFLQKLNQRMASVQRLRFALPTESQWEYACRAGTTVDFGGAGNLDEMGWYSDNSGSKTHAVGQKKPNAWGLYDMHGNVWEWCSDWYGDYPSGAVTDPVGHSDGLTRVRRGGDWSNGTRFCQSAIRRGSGVSFRHNSVGFRIALVSE